MLTTVTGSPSHARAVLPFARAVGAAGHDVVVACPPELAATFDGEPVRVAAVLPSMRAAVEAVSPMLADLGGPPSPAVVVPLLFGGPHVTTAVRALRELCADARPDLVLRDGGETAGLLYAEEIGVPHVPAPSGAGNVMTAAAMAEQLAARRRELGLAEPDAPVLAPWGRLDCMPAAYSFAGPDVPPASAFRQDDEVVPGQALPAWVGALPPGRPLVLAGLGSALPMMAGDGTATASPADPAAALRVLLAAVDGVDAEVIVATGGIEHGAGPVAEHVHLTDWVPQPLLLGCVDLFVTHGGYNGVREAVRHGVPMVVMPQFGDQEHNADRVADLGLGTRVPAPADVTPDAVATAAGAVLDDPAVRAETRRAQRAMLALPPIDAEWPEIVLGVARGSG